MVSAVETTTTENRKRVSDHTARTQSEPQTLRTYENSGTSHAAVVVHRSKQDQKSREEIEMESTLSVADPYWLFASTFDGDKLCVRRSYWLDDAEIRHDYPELAGFIDRQHLNVVEEFEEDDQFMMGGAVVSIYQAAA